MLCVCTAELRSQPELSVHALTVQVGVQVVVQCAGVLGQSHAIHCRVHPLHGHEGQVSGT